MPTEKKYMAEAMTRISVLTLALVALAGCGHVTAVRIYPARPVTFELAATEVAFSKAQNEVHSADLGSLLFRRIVTVPSKPELGIAADRRLALLPGIDGWMHAWTYTGKDAVDAKVYTHPSYHNGSIGVMVDHAGKVATNLPMIQVYGAKRGRRWPVLGGPMFANQPTQYDGWALRYGGQREDGHRFVVVDFVDDKEKDVVQDLRVSNEDSFKGFSVKGVTVRILSYDAGRITYMFNEQIARP